MYIVRNKELQMSKMSDLSIMIQERLERGEEPVDIAYALDIPISWIFEEQEQLHENNSPFATINS
jgi:hypothetical protein